MKCTLCKKEVIFPFSCRFCKSSFCSEHRLPENHDCNQIPPKTTLSKYYFKKENAFVSEDELHFERKNQPKDQPPYQSLEAKKKSNRKVLVIVTVLAFLMLSTILFMDYNYKINGQKNFDLAFQLGTDAGETTGYADGYSKGEQAGYDEGYDRGEEIGYVQGLVDGTGSGYSIRDPTYQEMTDFISSDTTDKNTYSTNYVCHDFSADVKNNAFLEGYRCGFVYIEFPNSAHAIVCFDTVDQGLIFIEPQYDNILTMTIGQSLFDYNLIPLDYDNTLIDYSIIW